MSNKITHPCVKRSCGRPVELSVEKRQHKCKCGISYSYPAVYANRPGKGYFIRQKELGKDVK